MRRAIARRALFSISVCCAWLLIVAAGAHAGAADGRLRANRETAWRDTRALLAELLLPPGAARSASRPPSPSLRPPRISALNTVGAHAWWTSRRSPAQVLAYFRAHAPGPSGQVEVVTEPTSSVILMWAIDGPHLFSQQLQLTVAALPDGRTGIMAQAQSTWMVPRSQSERVPSGVRAVAVTLRIGTGLGGTKHRRSHIYRITGAARVDAIVSAIDALPIVQPGIVYSCAELLQDVPQLTLRFLSATGSTVARAQVNVFPGRHGASGWTSCDPIDFWIGARRQTPLTSHTFVSRIATMLGADFS